MPSRKQPTGLHIRISCVSFSDLLRCYICISISLKQYFWKLCINFFVLYSQRKESVPLLWHNQMCYSSKAMSLMETTSFECLIRNFNENHTNFCSFSSIMFRPPWERWKIWPNLAKGVECTVLHSFAMENGDLIHCIALQKSLFSVTQLLALQKI